MVIYTEGYFDDAERDWLRAMRMMKSAQYGAHVVPEERRLYVKDNDVFLYVPDVPVYKDEEGKLFFDKKDLEGWKKLEKFKDMFEDV